MSKIEVNEIAARSGSTVSLASGVTPSGFVPAGGIIQTVINTSTSTVSTSSTSPSDLITASISPKFNNSVIHIEGYVSRMQVAYGSSNAYASLYITDPAGNNLTLGVLGTAAANSSPMSLFATHSPSSTSSQTYKIRLSIASGGTSSVSTDGQRYTIKIMEIAQ